MEYRNPKYVHDGRIDCEINHPDFGWIAFTADANDPEPLGSELHAQITLDGGIAEADPAPTINATNISARQLYLQLNAINKWDSLQTILTAPGNEFLQGLFDRSHDFSITDQYVIDMAALLNEDLQTFFNAAKLL